MLNKVLTLVKAQISAFFGGITSYLVTVLMREIFLHHIPPHANDISYVQSLVAVGIGETIGAVVNFTINKTWAFKSKNSKYKHKFLVQFSRFVFVVVQSIILKSTGVYLLTTHISHIDFKVWLLFVYFLVSVSNYLLQRYWVFSKVKSPV